jgi:hypothetical protein
MRMRREEMIRRILGNHPECYGRHHNWRNGCRVCECDELCDELKIYETIHEE